ncbi:MAG: YlxR family protein [Deltaproteobacteria bacterium]|nr:YlxR family protein [Deltaproteobacteria bacterium]
MALGGLVLSDRGHIPQRTCTGCRTTAAQHELVRVAFDGSRLVVDRTRRLSGRGAYVHARAACVTIPGLAKSLRRAVSKADQERIVAGLPEMSPAHDNCDLHGRSARRPRTPAVNSSVKSSDPDEVADNAVDFSPGLAGADTVETPPRNKAKDDRSEDARV